MNMLALPSRPHGSPQFSNPPKKECYMFVTDGNKNSGLFKCGGRNTDCSGYFLQFHCWLNTCKVSDVEEENKPLIARTSRGKLRENRASKISL